VTILIGGFVVAFLGAPIGALIVLVVLKTAFDLGLHRREHAGFT
jgi:fumarate reductase subunit D